MTRILGNMYKVAFWAIAHLAYDPTLLQSIRAEVMPSVKKGELDEAYLVDRCPKLDSFINEILRLTVASPLVRETVAPTVLGGKILQPGNKLLVSLLALCRWSTVNPTRFLTVSYILTVSCGATVPSVWSHIALSRMGNYRHRRAIDPLVAGIPYVQGVL